MNINAQPNAGADATPQVVCDSNTAVINLFNLITGEQSGGVWTRTGTGGTFDPIAGTFAPAPGATTSTFTYTITGTLPCVDDFSLVNITINAQPDAGTSGSTLVCDSSTTLIDLNTLISGQQAGGTWTRTGTGTGGVFNAGAGTFMPTGATTSTFEYTLVGTAPCVNDVSTATVNINPEPNAGADGATQIVCDSSTTTINLFNLITGEQSGGVWTRTGTGGAFDPIAGTFTPAPGATSSTFTYTVTGALPCVDDFSLVNVTINAQPNAGTSGSTLVCDSSTALIDLNTVISGQQSGGTWTQLAGSGGLFDPILGTFTPASGAITSRFQYELVGVAPCVNATSVVTVTINAQPNAGTSGGVTICETDTTLIDLNTIISGQQPGGTWTRTGTGTGGTFNATTGTFISAIGATTSTFEYRLPGVAPCVDATSVATVTINTQPNAGVADPPLLVCDNSNTPINLFDLITGEQSGGTFGQE
ncbi:MAG: hypothetical protein IPP30_08905 [Flavobacterium sp.]|nr:hypothetical protein [Flavobacterium sp.]